ncbi:hypothetical protein UPYG_G00058600 [Umbra pygmaea]|uniref:G-patch domain-containing protein n=1 Tax=Umbra pygmaea TaxID=75934 RepID=A0ABD0X8T4_UMBPY
MSSMNYFTPAREDEVLWLGNAGAATGPRPNRALDGEEARHFYQSLIEEGDTRVDDMRTKRQRREGQGRRETNTGREEARQLRREWTARNGSDVQASRQQATTTTTELEGLRLLRCAQEGDLSGVRGLLSRGVDVNFQDGWWWTGLMCAAAAGQRDVVRLFLQRGAAWVGVVDTQGRDARELARRAGHSGVVEELDQHGARTGGDDDHSSNQLSDTSSPAVQTLQNQNQSRWCPDCSADYTCSRESHLSSTLHLFSLSRAPPTPQYCLHPFTPAYQMMLRSGWTPGGGLGPEGEGPKQPVRTVLKRDSKGLGYGPTPRPKVTHFQAKDLQAVRQTAKRRRERRGEEGDRRRRKEERERTWERDFRSSFNTSDP